METQQTPRKAGITKYHLPAEPFRRVVRTRIGRTEGNEIYERETQVAMEIWGPDCEWDVKACHDALRHFLKERGARDVIHFDAADRLLSRLGLSSLWVSDAELSSLYYGADLATLDVASPTCDKVRQEIVETVEEIGTRKTADVFNTSTRTVRRAYQRFATA